MAWLGKMPSLPLSVRPPFAELLRTDCGLMLEISTVRRSPPKTVQPSTSAPRSECICGTGTRAIAAGSHGGARRAQGGWRPCRRGKPSGSGGYACRDRSRAAGSPPVGAKRARSTRLPRRINALRAAALITQPSARCPPLERPLCRRACVCRCRKLLEERGDGRKALLHGLSKAAA
jgi:hypothetical protein